MTQSKSTHESLSGTSETKMGSERSFGLVFAGVFACLGGWKLYSGAADWGWGALAIAFVFAVLALAAPGVLKGPNLLWFRLGLLLHKIISPLVLGLLFFLTVTPTALVMRLLGKDPLRLRLDPDAKSYWIHRDPPGPEPKSMTQQF